VAAFQQINHRWGGKLMIATWLRTHRCRMLGGIALLALACAQLAAAQEAMQFDIPEESAMSALQRFARQSGIQVFAPAELLRGVTTRAVRGSYTPEEALGKMLEGSNLNASSLDGGRTFTLKAPGRAETASLLEEVIVTAHKREENLRNVAGSVTAITGRQMEQMGAQGFADYLTRTPGVQYNGAIPGWSSITIRGVSTTTSLDVGQSATGTYINDVPLTDPFLSAGIPDVDAFDVERVEVLRGPQGTLFGSATLGGAVNYIAARANLESFSGRVETSAASTSSASKLGYTGKAMVNLPLITDKLAVRLVGTHRNQPGYIDNLGVGRKNLNELTVSGGRMSLEWQATEQLRLSALSLYSKTQYDDAFTSRPLLGDLVRSTIIPEPYQSEAFINSIDAAMDFDFATLNVSYAHSSKDLTNNTDFTPNFGGIFRGRAPPLNFVAERNSDGRMLEARLTSPSGRKLEWLFGVSRNEMEISLPSHSSFAGAAALITQLGAQGAFGTVPADFGARVAPNDQYLDFRLSVEGTETASFGEMTYHLGDFWRVTAGGRFFRTEVDNRTVQTGLLNFLSTRGYLTTSSGSQEEDKFTPKLSLAYQPNDDFMYYALYSEGFRFGGPNAIPQVPQFPSPSGFSSDSLKNYELGARAAFLERTLTLDATVYYIDWQDIQLGLIRGDNLAYADNVGAARNVGVDLSTNWLIADRLELQLVGSYLDAEMRDDVVATALNEKGARLPGASQWRSAASVRYSWDNALTPALVFTHRYVSEAPSNLAKTAYQGGYSVFDLRGTFEIGGANLAAFVENIADKRGITVGEFGNATGPRAYYIKPRTVGLRVTYDF
jgi:iron complex outermembrane recepter protein